MKSLIIGASGQVGEHLIHQLRADGQDVTGTFHAHERAGMHRLDIQDAAAVEQMLADLQPEVIYLPASLTNVDYCEQHPDVSYQNNVLGIHNVVQAANRANAKVVYFSSDYVFDGQNGPYDEDAPANPICVYGQHKLIAEHLVATGAANSLIVRTTVVYGWESQGKNFIYRLINNLSSNQPLRTPDDQIGSPTYAPDLANAVMELVKRNASGVFHVVGPKRASRYDFAREAARLFGLDERLVEAVPTSELNQPARRPLNAGMRVTKAEQVLQRPLVDFSQGLRMMVETREV